MTRYRLVIYDRSDKDKYIGNIAFESEEKNIKKVLKKIKTSLKFEIFEREKKLIEFLNRKKKGFIQELIDEIPDGLIDFESRGKDISKKEFLENEIWFDRYT